MPIDERWSRLGPASNYVNLEGIEFREYQYNIIKAIFEKGNTLVVLPTGLGKTLIAVYSMADSLSSNRKAMLLAPTKPLAEQHYLTLQKMLKLKEGELMLLLGTTNKTKREEQMANARVIVATPQTVANELKKGTLDISRYHSAVFDECHKAVGKYAYTYIADTCSEFGVKTIGLTASPGSKKEKIKKLLQTLKTEHIESRVSSDYDVSKYVMPKSMHIMDIEMTDRIKEMAAMLRPI
jgi:ERCC4-like helicases